MNFIQNRPLELYGNCFGISKVQLGLAEKFVGCRDYSEKKSILASYFSAKSP